MFLPNSIHLKAVCVFGQVVAMVCCIGVCCAQGPRIECNGEMLERARLRVRSNREPFKSYWQAAQPDIARSKQLVPSPYLAGDSLQFHQAAQKDGIAARLLAYAWALVGDDAAGEHAVAIIRQWAEAESLPGTQLDRKIRFPNSSMDVSRGMLPFVAAYDLLRDHPSMDDRTNQNILRWFRALVPAVKRGIQRWNDNDDFGKQRFQNHHAAHVLGLTILGAALNDEGLIQFAIDSPENPKDFKELITGLILVPEDEPHGGRRGKPLHPGEIQDRYRTNQGMGLTYCHLSLTMMLYTADVLQRVTGKDWLNWQGRNGESLKASATFYSDFFRLRNARIKGDYYFRDHDAIQNNTPYLGTFEVALGHWPDVPNLKAVVRSMNRSRIPRSWLCYYGLPLLTHGVD